MLGADGTGEETIAIDDGGNLVATGGVDRLAAIERLERGETIGLGLDAVGDPKERCGAFAGGGARPCVKGLAGGGHGAVDLRGRGFGHVEDDLASAGVEHLFGGVLPCLEAVADQKIGLDFHGSTPLDHLPPPAVSEPPRVR